MSELKNHRIGVIGSGRFGMAFIQGLLKSQLFDSKKIWACDRSDDILNSIRELGIMAVSDFRLQAGHTDILVLSVKPAQVIEVIHKINQSEFPKKTLIISVAAGTATSKIETALTNSFSVVRAMPNSPCMVQEGVTALCGGSRATAADLNLAREIFQTLGRCLEIDESHFDLVTALSGSGPAYFYYIMEAMIETGVQRGLTFKQAVELVSQTAKGSAMMVQNLSRSPAELRADVATPGGCTMEALKVLEFAQVNSIFVEAIKKATEVAGTLGNK